MGWAKTFWRNYRRPVSQEELKVQRNLSVLLVLVLVAVVGVMVLRDARVWAGPDDEREAIQDGVQLLMETSNLVRSQYVNEVDNKKLYEHAVQGMLQGLDPFSSFISDEELAEFNKRVKGTFGGIGIVIGMEDGWLTVISPIEDAPAYRAGVMAGDKIISIEGKSSEGISLDDAVKMLTGKPGTEVTFQVVHMGTLQRETFTVKREEIHIKTIKGDVRLEDGQWNYMIDKDAGIAYIRMTSFTEDTVHDLEAALAEARKQGMKGLILDLRWNGGGILEAATGVSDLFVESGVIVSTRGRKSKEEVWEAKAEGTVTDIPMVVLVNDRSASASEIVAGCLQDHKRAILVGERTFGKGSVQRIFNLRDGQCAVKLTVAKYYLPLGREIHRDEGDKEWGVDPQIVVPMSFEEYAAVVKARRDSEVLHTNGKTRNGNSTPAPESGDQPKSKDQGATKDSLPKSPDAEEALPDSLTRPSEKKAEPDKNLRDRQLEAAIIALKVEMFKKGGVDPAAAK